MAVAARGFAAGHPRVTYLLCFAEMLERFSYYAMSGLLALFLAGAPADGGFGWPGVLAIEVYGIYVGMLWFAPLLGGWVGDRWLGARRAVVAGGVMIALGQALMLGPAVLPRLIGRVSGLPVARALVEARVALGFPLPGAAIRQAVVGAIERLAPGASGAEAALLAYQLPAFGFFAGLAVLALGNALLKPNITVMLGEVYAPADPRRDEAFTLFYIGINVGAVASALVAGTIAERFGWAIGFGVASLVMAAGVLALVRFRRLVPAGLGDRRRRPVSAGRPAPLPRGPLLYVVAMTLVAAVFWGAFMQTYGLLNLFAFNDVDRNVAGFVVPAPWFSSLTPFFLTFVGPLFQGGLNVLRRRNVVPDTISRFVAGLMIAAAACAMLAAAIALQPAGTRNAMVWLILFYLLLAVGELSLSPAGNAMAARHVPPAVAGRLMAIWFLCYGLGSFLSAALGSLSAVLSVAGVLAVLAAGLLATAGLLCLVRHPLQRLVRSPAGGDPPFGLEDEARNGLRAR